MKRWIAGASRAFAATLLLIGTCSAEADTVGAMKQVVQTVYGTPPQGQQVAKRVGDAVVHNELFETWKDSRALVEFIDGSHLTLGANSKVVIDEFVFDPANIQGNALIKLSVGTLRFVTGQMPHGGVVIKTPTATLTLRGTDVTVHVHPDGTTDTAVHGGRVDAHNDRTGDSSDLGPGEGATSGEGGNNAFGGDGGVGDGGGNSGGGTDTGQQSDRRSDANQAHDDFSSHDTPANDSSDDGDDGDCGCI